MSSHSKLTRYIKCRLEKEPFIESFLCPYNHSWLIATNFALKRNNFYLWSLQMKKRSIFHKLKNLRKYSQKRRRTYPTSFRPRPNKRNCTSKSSGSREGKNHFLLFRSVPEMQFIYEMLSISRVWKRDENTAPVSLSRVLWWILGVTHEERGYKNCLSCGKEIIFFVLKARNFDPRTSLHILKPCGLGEGGCCCLWLRFLNVSMYIFLYLLCLTMR